MKQHKIHTLSVRATMFRGGVVPNKHSNKTTVENVQLYRHADPCRSPIPNLYPNL